MPGPVKLHFPDISAPCILPPPHLPTSYLRIPAASRSHSQPCLSAARPAISGSQGGRTYRSETGQALARQTLGEATRHGSAESSQLLDFGRGSCLEAHVGREERRDDGHSAFRCVFLWFRGGEWKREAGERESPNDQAREPLEFIHRPCLLGVFKYVGPDYNSHHALAPHDPCGWTLVGELPITLGTRGQGRRAMQTPDPPSPGSVYAPRLPKSRLDRKQKAREIFQQGTGEAERERD